MLMLADFDSADVPSCWHFSCLTEKFSVSYYYIKLLEHAQYIISCECTDLISDAIQDVRTVEDEIHNCQAVIDSLSLDILNTPLSHITGQDVIAGDRTAIGDLLEVFSGLMEFILEDITSAASIDGAAPSDVDGWSLMHAYILFTVFVLQMLRFNNCRLFV
jgi:hypothetical protein